MCVLALAWKAHPKWLLIVAGNRDELHSRAAAPLSRWETAAEILAGKDMVSGGTWLGVSERGRMAVVTNLRGFGTAQPNRSSRGALVTDMLMHEGMEHHPTDTELKTFNPFNLFVANRDSLQFLSNRPDVIRTSLEHGIYGLSNGRLDEPWPKTVRLKAGLLDWLTGDATAPEQLLEILRDDTLSGAGIATSIPSDISEEARESPIFILDPIYGTRCSTVVAVSHDGRGVIIERRFKPDGAIAGTTHESFFWPV